MEKLAVKQIGNSLILVFCLIAGVIILLVWIYFLIKKSSSKDLPSASWQEYSSFRESIKSEGSDTEKIMSYGKTYFTYDEAGKKVFIRTGKIPEGMTINSGDIASYELYRDGRAAEPEEASPDFDPIKHRHIEISCFDLHIIITLKDGTEIILPLIDSPAQYEYVYTRALDVANEITAILKEIIYKKN